MTHLHLKECSSTQEKAFELLTTEREVLVSTEKQTSGEGRRGRQWFDAQESLAISFNLSPNEVLTLTSLELGVLCKNFIKENFDVDVELKWPNDIYLNGKKIGGILIQNKNSHLVAGIGINLFQPSSEISTELKGKLGSLFKEATTLDNEKISNQLWKFIKSKRLSKNEVITQWENGCAHLNKKVNLIEDKETVEGIFVGIGEFGEALIESKEGVVKVYNATLIMNP